MDATVVKRILSLGLVLIVMIAFAVELTMLCLANTMFKIMVWSFDIVALIFLCCDSS